MAAAGTANGAPPDPCGQCGSTNPPASRFCNQCGHRLDAAAPASAVAYTPPHLLRRGLAGRSAMQGARKLVTVLFADLCGSTQLAERLGAEPWHDLLNRYLGLLTEQVHRFEGTVNQYTGDGVMALFGAPIAHEDHALRACLAALAMQAEVRRFAQELRLQQGINLFMRVGLNSGEVVVGAIGDDLRMDYTAQGASVHLAARMESICEPGSVYLTGETAALVRGYAQLRDLGETEVAGVSHPVRVHELLSAGAGATRLERALARGAAHFIGRQPELDTLHEHLASARGGRGGVIAVTGDAGIGKSRLCHEFTQACERSGVSVLRAHGLPYGRAFLLLPVQMLLRQRLGVVEGEDAEALRQRVAGAIALHDPRALRFVDCAIDFLAGGAAAVADAGAMDEALRFLCDFLLDASTVRVILVEDVHFLDAASRDVLEQLCRRAAASRVLLVVNFRADYAHDWLLPHLTGALPLAPLGTRELGQIAEALVGSERGGEALRRHLVERAGGNPFFLEEAVYALAESGDLAGHPGAYTLTRPLQAVPLPDTVHALIAARIDRLAPQPKALLQAAAVAGQEFATHEIERLAPAGRDAWHSLEATGFLRSIGAVPGERYAFAHALTREVAYREQLEAQRRATHARMATQLEAAAGDGHEQAGAIALHWLRAGEARTGGRWAVRAGIASTGSMPRDAAAWFRQGLEQLEGVESDDEAMRARFAAHTGLLRLAQMTSDVSAAQADVHYAAARELAAVLGDPRADTELLISYASEQLHRGDAAASVALLERALDLAVAHGAGDIIERFRLLVLLSFNVAGRLDEGLRRVNAAAGDAWLLVPVDAANYRSRGFRGVMLFMQGELALAARELTDALAVSERLGRPEGWLHAMLVDLAWFRGEGHDLLFHARRALEIADAAQSGYFRAVAVRSLGLAHGLAGTPDQALALMEDTRPMVAPGGPAHQLEGSFLAVLAELHLAMGNPRRAARIAARGVLSARASGSRLWELRAWLAMLAMPVESARRARAADALTRAFQLCDAIHADGFRGLLHLARARWSEDRVLAQHERERAQRIFERIGASGHLARMASGSAQP